MFDILRIAWRNIGRNRRRSVLSAAAVAFAVAVLCFSMALQQGSYAQMIHNTVRNRTGHLQLQHVDYWPDRELTKRMTGIDTLMTAVADTPHMVAAAPRIQTAALVSSDDRTFGATIQGVSPEAETMVSTAADKVITGRFLTDTDIDGAVLGSMLARNLGVSAGDEIVFVGQAADGSIAAGTLTVTGTIQSGMSEIDRSLVIMHVRHVQTAFSMPDAATEIAILLESDRVRSAAHDAIADCLRAVKAEHVAVVEWPTVLPGVEQSMKLDWISGLIMYVILVCVVGFGIANTYLMAYLERIHEFGVLLSLGMRPRLLSMLVYLESALLTLAGIATGLAAGVPIVMYLNHVGLNFGKQAETLMASYGLSAVVYPQLSPLVVGCAVGIVGGVTLTLALYPAIRAANLKPVEALRHA